MHKSQNSETIEAISAHFYYLFLFRIGFDFRAEIKSDPRVAESPAAL